MTTFRTLAAALSLLAAASWAQQPVQPERKFQRAETFNKRVQQYVVHDAPRIRIDDVRVVDGTGAAAAEHQALLIRDGRIEKMGPAASLAGDKADVVIEGKGRTVMPGLVMMHEHLLFIDALGELPHYMSEPFASPKAYFAFGATTIRTGGTFNGNDDLQAARLVREGQIVGPEIRVTAPFVNGTGSFAFQMRPITDPEDARRLVQFWVWEGATSFKIYMNITREVLAAAIEAAHQRGMQVTGHLCSITMREAAELGIDSLEHGVAMATDFVKDKQPDRCPPGNAGNKALLDLPPDSQEMRDLIELLVKRKVAITSTLAVYAAGIVDWFPSADDLLMLNHESRASARRALARYRKEPERRETQKRLLEAEMRFERAFVAAGGTLLAGTDPTGWGGTLPGAGGHAELRLLVQAGFTPLEAIRFATQAGARFQRIDDRVGTVATSKQADLLLVNGKPDQDIAQIGAIDLVFKDGIAYDAVRLRDSLRGKIGR